MSLDSSMSLNIPSSLLVNAAPHSGGSQNHNMPQGFIHTSTYFHASSALMLDGCQNLDYTAKGQLQKNVWKKTMKKLDNLNLLPEDTGDWTHRVWAWRA